MISQSVPKIESWEKVTGAAQYNNDVDTPGMLHAFLLTSPLAHANIKNIDTSAAYKVPGVLAVVTGELAPMTGPILVDRPALAKGKVRYYGEPVAVVVARSENAAMLGAQAIKVDYEQLPVVNSIEQALQPGATLVHEWLGKYSIMNLEIHPEPGSNVAERIYIRKGDLNEGWEQSEVVIEASFSMPQSDHGAMETRSVCCQINPDGRVIIHTASQGPFIVKELLAKFFQLNVGDVEVHVPLVGGAFGGKTPVQLEYIAYMASQAVGGQPVKLVNTREQDICSSPGHVGAQAHVKLGAKRDGTITAVEMAFTVDCGAYTDSAPDICRAIAANCTGPFNIANVSAEVVCVYTNHPYTTAFRGFGHIEYTFVMARMMDKLAFALGINAIDLQLRNAIRPGDTSPTYVRLTKSNLGNLPLCLEKLRQLINWDEGQRIDLGNGKVRAKGLACWWKTSSSPHNARSGATIMVEKDGSLALNTGVVELGPGSKTALAQMLATKMGLDISQIHVHMDVNTLTDPWHWKTVASMSLYMAGNAVMEAAEDLIRQIKQIGAIALRSSPESLEVYGGRVFLKADPAVGLDINLVGHGYQYPEGNSIGGQLIGRGTFIMPHLTPMDRQTGHGRPGPAWTVGAQAIEVEYDTCRHTYRTMRVATVVDLGKVINPSAAKGVINGGASMGLGLGTQENLVYDAEGTVLTSQFRTFKMARYGENPEYLVDFVETPDKSAAFGVRGIGEHGIVGVPGALANALSAAAQVDLHQLPITPETIWRKVTGQ